MAKLGEAAGPALRKLAAKPPSTEALRRAERLLEKLAEQPPTGDELRALRGVEVLEQAGTPEATRLLTAIARGEPEARRTREAKAALLQLERRRLRD